MSNSYTVLWNAERVKSVVPLAGQPVPFLAGGPHLSQPLFSRAGVSEGDTVYPIFVHKGTLHVLAGVVVKCFSELESFISSRKDLFPATLRGHGHLDTLERTAKDRPWIKAFWWTCVDEVIVPATSTAISVKTSLSAGMLERLTYVSKRGSRQVRGVKDGRITSVLSLQGVYRLSQNSAADFAAAVDQASGQSNGTTFKLEA